MSEDQSDTKPLAYAIIRQKGQTRIPLVAGRHLVGDSAFAKVRVGDGGNRICALLQVSERSTTLKCTALQPVIFIEGRRLQLGEVVVIGDAIELTVGQVPLSIVSATLGAAANAAERVQDDRPARRDRSAAEAANPLQDAVDKALGNPDRIRNVLSRRLLDELNVQQVELEKIDSPEVREAARLKLHKIITSIELPPGFPVARGDLEEQVFNEVMGLGPLEPLLGDPAVSEIMVNRRDQIFIEKGGKLQLAPVSFSSDLALHNVIERIVSTVGRRIDISSPIVDARLLDGSRVNAVIPPLALKGPCLTIRRFSKKPINPDKLVEWGSMSPSMFRFLRAAVEEHKNILISGGTGSGKTTLLNALSSFIADHERVITVEDAAELQLQQEHVISLETRPANLEGRGAVTIRDLVKNTLRMRPDRIIVGECRGPEALDMLQAMNTGHDGSMTTAHANTPEDMLRRLETMVLMAGMELPLRAIREQIVSAITVVVQQTRRKDGRRLVTEIAWIRGMDREQGSYDVVQLFSRDRQDEPVAHREALQEFIEVEAFDYGLDQILGG